MKRRPSYVPHQSKISVQDVFDYSTPEGAAMANEEMRRLRLNQVQDTAEETIATVPALPPSAIKPRLDKADKEPDKDKDPTKGKDGKDGKDATWALTTEHNMRIITAKVVQALDFNDTGKDHPKYKLGVNWQLIEASLIDYLKTIPDAKVTAILAWAYTNPLQFLTWLDLALNCIMSVHGEPDYTEGSWRYNIKLVNDEWTPGYNKYYGTNCEGRKGFHPVPGLHVIKIPFSYNTPSVSSRAVIPEGNMVLRTETVITEVFDEDVTFTASAGVDLMDENYINFMYKGMYLNQWHYDIEVESTVDLSIITLSTQGAGVIYVWYTEPEL